MCNMLSYVEFYRPKFFLLENVLGLLSYKLEINKVGPQEGNIVAHGVVKFILRALTSLGYVAFSHLPTQPAPPPPPTPQRTTLLKRACAVIATGIKCASVSYKPESTAHRRVAAASSSGARGAAFLSPSSQSRRTTLRRRSGRCSLTRVSSSTTSRATRIGPIVARHCVPSPWTTPSLTWYVSAFYL